MIVVNFSAELSAKLAVIRKNSGRIALVPTMGALHQGHLNLLELAKRHADQVILSIFVNPTQFNSKQDLDKYPRTLDHDLALATQAGVDVVFTPTVSEIYRDSSASGSVQIVAGSRAAGLCGATRPGHFDGVVTIVSILFNLIRPDCAVFGAKDYQQLRVIEQLVSDLHYPIEIISAPIVRDQDGLALSSRNVRLSTTERAKALAIPQALSAASAAVAAGEKSAANIIADVRKSLESSGAEKIDYIEIVDVSTLQPLQKITMQAQLLIAAFYGGVRLIDNIRLASANLDLQSRSM